MDFSGKQVVVTGGTGALGSAVVGALLEAGARCTVSFVHLSEAQRFAHREHAKRAARRDQRSGRRGGGRQAL